MWDRRNIFLNEGDSLAETGLSKDRDVNFNFIFAYAPDSLDENRLLFQMARYNFTNFLVRNFVMTIEDSYGMHHMVVSGFRNFDEARQYSRLLLQQESIKKASAGARPFVISEANLALINGRYSYNDYDSFYVANFAPLPPQNIDKLYEPLPVEVKERNEGAPADEREEERREMKAAEEEDPVKPILPAEDVAPGLALPVKPKTAEEEAEEQNEGNTFVAPAETEIVVPKEDTEVTVPAETEVTVPAENTEVVVPAETEVTVPTENTEVVVPVETEVVVPTENTEVVVPVETEVVVPTENTEVVVPVENTPATQQEEFVIESNDTPTPVEDVEVIDIEEEDPSGTPVEEYEIIIEDEKKSTRDLEDEYFELDGF
jgi:hypothetical protein